MKSTNELHIITLFLIVISIFLVKDVNANVDYYGDSRDGNLIITSGEVIDLPAIRTNSVGDINAGSTEITVLSSAGFLVGDEICIITMTDNNTNLNDNLVGQHEFFKIIEIVGNNLFANRPISNNYQQSKVHQVVEVPNYNIVEIYGTLSIQNWNGMTGGFMCFRSNHLDVKDGGNINLVGDGYRGAVSVTDWSCGAPSGEGLHGRIDDYGRLPRTVLTCEGGGAGNYDGMAGGGGGAGHRTVGVGGWTSQGGFQVGSFELNKPMLGGGGGGGAVVNQYSPTLTGGNGGGICIIFSEDIIVSGNISCNGNPGQNGVYRTSGSGGGAGGSLRISSQSVINNGCISSRGGIGGSGYGNEYSYSYPGGNGSDGRIRIDYLSLVNNGLISPGIDYSDSTDHDNEIHINHVIDERFNNNGNLPTGWTLQSNSVMLTTPWTPILEYNDDWAIRANQAAFSTPRTEWLISPIYDLTGFLDNNLGFTHTYMHAGSTATVKYSTNGGVSWQNLTSYSTTTSGNIVTNIASWANGQANVRFAFVFTGTFVVGGASWRLDDFYLDGVRTAPIASTPQPTQPPTAWGSLTGSVGCTWIQPLGVSGTDLEVRIDANGDGDYLDGGAESWTAITDQSDASPLSFTTSVVYLSSGTHLCYELRARSGQGLWGYSGTANAEGILDDWYVSIDVETTPPAFADPIPAGQPSPAWLPMLSPLVGVSVLDAGSGVDASTLAWRIDLDQNGSYSGPAEDWQALSGYTSASQIDVSQIATLPADGEYLVEFRAKDLAENGPSTSGNIVLRTDATLPTASTLFVSGSGLNSVTLMFSPTEDDHFARYEMRCSTDTLFDESDLLWTDAQDPNLAQTGTYQTTVTGLASGAAWYFRLWAVDLAGNRSPASNLVRKVTEGSEVSPVTSLQAVLQGTDILLSWTAPTTDIYGQSPVAIEEYQVHSSVDARFTPNASTLVGTTFSTSFVVVNPGGDIAAYLRVVAVGAGPGNPYPVPMIRVPAGTFQMGSTGGDAGELPEHPVSLTNAFYLGTTEVTNVQYRNALQWAFDQGLVTANETTVFGHGNHLINLGSPSCMIGFNNGVFSLKPVQIGSHTGSPSDNHPVTDVTWYGASCFCDWVSLQMGLTPYYNGNWNPSVTHNPYDTVGFRLPTEAEWEFAAQFNDERTFPWGNALPSALDCNWNHFVNGTTPIGSYPNGTSFLGFADFSGNVWEWCNDWYSNYSATSQIDPFGPETGSLRILRGGGWDNLALHLRVACRNGNNPDNRSGGELGFRICRTAQ
jgi:formylglycine-generating enzyme required for sulfatase activity